MQSTLVCVRNHSFRILLFKYFSNFFESKLHDCHRKHSVQCQTVDTMSSSRRPQSWVSRVLICSYVNCPRIIAYIWPHYRFRVVLVLPDSSAPKSGAVLSIAVTRPDTRQTVGTHVFCFLSSIFYWKCITCGKPMSICNMILYLI